jgi:hypothetical protein
MPLSREKGGLAVASSSESSFQEDAFVFVGRSKRKDWSVIM